MHIYICLLYVCGICVASIASAYICLLYECGMCVTSISSAYICLLYVCGMCVASIASTYICLLYVCGICVASIANAFPFLQKTIRSKGIGTISKKLRAPEITEKDRVKSATEVLKNTIQVCVLDWWKRLHVSVEFSSLLLYFIFFLNFLRLTFSSMLIFITGFFLGGGGGGGVISCTRKAYSLLHT